MVSSAPAKIISPVMPNAGLTAAYQRKLDALIAKMQRSVRYWVLAKYRQNTPVIMAQDASPAMEMRRTIRKLGRRWLRQFDDAAPVLAAYFATGAADRTDAALKAALRDAGISVRFKMTAAQNDAYQAVIGEQVALIKSIGQQYLTQVEGAVMRSVQNGHDLGRLAKTLEETYGVTKRRAALIARDQNAKATATLTRVRQQGLGITKAKWLHSAGGREPRPSHVAMSGKTYDVAKGMWDPDERAWIHPGELINCRCVSVSVVPGFDD